MNISQSGEGWLLGKDFYFGPEVKDGIVSLSPTKWEIMKYGADAHMHIDFPGEYDVKWVSIVCVESNDRLHYFVFEEGHSFCIAQHRWVLDSKNLEEVDTWIVTEAGIKDQLAAMEMGGKVVVLGGEETETEEA